jgi:hypothetical protein
MRTLDFPADMLELIRRYIKEKSELKRFNRLSLAERDIVFYSESESYWPYFAPIINSLIKHHKRTVAYLTSSENDPILSQHREGINAFYIGSGYVRTVAFVTLDANVFVMTTPGLETTHLKRSKLPVHYVFLPHNMTSTHMVFQLGAHNAFDTIFCVGPHQKNELREAEELYGIKPRDLVEGGYARLDNIMRKAKHYPQQCPKGGLRILIAPTWGKEALIGYGCEPLLNALLKAGHTVILRPHRDSEIQDADRLAQLDKKYIGKMGFNWAKNMSREDSFYRSDLLITDWSGAAFSFAFGLERPVLSIDLPTKINNKDFGRFTNVPLEISLREKMGGVLAPDKFSDAPMVIEEILRDTEQITKNLRAMRETWVYRSGDAADYAAAHIIKLAEQKS